jgi:phosphate transport system protein
LTETHFQKKLNEVKEELLKMGGLVEETIDQSTQALVHRDEALARKIIDGDVRIDALENEIEDRCVTLLATQQPVAVDLRFITTAMRISTYLERMGDRAVNLCVRTMTLASDEPLTVPPLITEMATVAQSMVKDCLDAFVRGDVKLAYKVLETDDELDSLNRKLLEEMIQHMMNEHRLIRAGVELILAGRHLERIGDEATNVSEEVVYMVEGRTIKHQESLAGH